MTKKQQINNISFEDSLAIVKKYNLIEIKFDTKPETIKSIARSMCKATSATPKQLL